MTRIIKLLLSFSESLERESSIPPPPFKASKRCGAIMNGLWYGRITPDEARVQAAKSGFEPHQIDRMILDATVAQSYWSQNTPPTKDNVPSQIRTGD